MAFTGRGKKMLALALEKMSKVNSNPTTTTISSSAKVNEWLTNSNENEPAQQNQDFNDYEDSGSEYIPDSFESDSDSEDCDLPPFYDVPMIDVQKKIESRNSFPVPMDEESMPCSTVYPIEEEVEAAMIVQPHNMVDNTSQKKLLTKKPKRPCLFCGKPQAQLARHLKRIHKEELEVKQACKLPRKERLRAFDVMKKNGIFSCNIIKKKKGENLDRERCQGSNDLAMCNGCRGFYSQKRIAKHKKTCSESHGTKSGSVNVKFLGDYGNDACVDDTFRKEIIQKFRNDETGNLCQTDPIIIKLGSLLWAKSARKDRRVIMNDMRTLGNLVLECKKVSHRETFTAGDIGDTENFDHLTKAIKNITINEHGKLKPGLKLAIGFLLKRLIKVLKGVYIQQKNMQKLAETDNFSSLLDLNWDFIFHQAQLACEQRRQNLRKPTDMPLEKDLTEFRNFILKETSRMTDDAYKKWDHHDFVYMRNLLVSRLTLFNARRGGEPARLLVSEWMDAQNGTWIDHQQVEGVQDPLERHLIGHLRLAYQSGKGSRRLVPVLFPKDTLPAIEKLITERQECGIADANQFLFPNTGMSEDHVIGWNSVQSVAKAMGDQLEKPNLLIADKFRHRTSTLFALLEIPSEKREMFYRHMGHTEQMNRDVYQSPLAIREITEVGRFLQNLDEKTRQESVHLHQNDSCSANTTPQVSVRDGEQENQDVSSQEMEIEMQSLQDDVVSSSITINSVQKNIAENKDDNERDPKTRQNYKSRSRRYFKWSLANTKTVCDFFSSTILDNTNTGSKGSLPSKKIIKTFIEETKMFSDTDFTQAQKISLIKAKIFNERSKERTRVQKIFDV